jgi:hypothetical protein
LSFLLDTLFASGLMVLLQGDSFRHQSSRSGAEVFSSSSHGLNRKASTIFLFVSIRQGFPFSILCRVITDKLVLLASSDLLIRSFSLIDLSGFSLDIFTISFQLLCIIIFTLLYFCNKITSIIPLILDPKMLGKAEEVTPRYRPSHQSRRSRNYGVSNARCF